MMYVNQMREERIAKRIRAVDVTYTRTYEVIGVHVFNVVDNANEINDCSHCTLVIINTPFSCPSSPSCSSSLSSLEK